MARKWGGDIRAVIKIPHDFEAPFDSRVGLDYDSKIVYYVRQGKLNDRVLSGIIHEMGHCFACLHSPGKTPSEIDFHGWEWIVAKSVGFTQDRFRIANSNYIVAFEHAENMGELTRKELSEYLKERIEMSQSFNLLDGNRLLALR